MSNPTGSTCWLTALHATVDALCACSLFMIEPGLQASEAVCLFGVYNVLAFMAQPLVGVWLDKRPARQDGCLVVSAVLLGLGALLTSAILLGIGNALFHVYGGKTLAQQTRNDMRRLGIFVSSGAFGIWLGAHGAGMALLCGLLALLSFCVWGYLRGGCADVAHTQKATAECAADDPAQKTAARCETAKPQAEVPADMGQPTCWFVALIVLIVFVRSYMGQLDPAQGRCGAEMLFVAMSLAVAGKAMGGFLAQWWGTRHTLVVALLAAGVFYLLGYYHSAWLLGLVWSLNITMPLTLGLANQALAGREGLAFGLLACVLAPGVALATLSSGQPLVYLLLYALVGTLVIEELVLLILRERRWQVLGAALVMNLLTNLPLNLYLLTQFPAGYPAGLVVGLEVGVVVVEAFVYWLVIRDVRRSAAYALCCNLASCLLPMLFLG